MRLAGLLRRFAPGNDDAHFPHAVQRVGGAPQMRDPGFCCREANRGPGSAAHHFVLRCAREMRDACALANAPPALLAARVTPSSRFPSQKDGAPGGAGTLAKRPWGPMT